MVTIYGLSKVSMIVIAREGHFHKTTIFLLTFSLYWGVLEGALSNLNVY